MNEAPTLQVFGIIFFIILLLTSFQNCGPGFTPDSQFLDSSSVVTAKSTFDKFQNVMSRNCNACHGNSGSAYPGIANFTNLTSEDAWATSNYVVPSDPSKSSIYTRLRFTGSGGNHNMPFSGAGFVDTMTQGEADIIQEFILSLSPVPGGDIKTLKQSPFSTLSKIKLLTNGEVLNSSEIDEAFGNDGKSQDQYEELDPAAIKVLVNRWLGRPSGKAKLKEFFKLNLQQEFELDTSFTFGNPSRPSSRDFIGQWQENLEESFTRSALDIVYNNKPFHEIATTRKHAVTTALLVSYSHADNDRRSGDVLSNRRQLLDFLNKSHANFPDQILKASDFNDWRFVNFTQIGSNKSSMNYKSVANIRNVKNGANYPLALPRVGFFNTLAFQLKWITNEDNQFRVTTNQALITALGQSFEAGDKTNHGNLAGLDKVHAKPSTACYSCHRLMDPMRETFKLYYNWGYRHKTDVLRDTPKTPEAKSPNFYFQGKKVASIKNMDQLGNAIATHPNFAKAWTQKLCQYANSMLCKEDDPEFLRVANRFKNSNFNFRTLFREFMASKLVLDGIRVPIGEEAYVSVNRANHFCHTLDTRINRYLANINKPGLPKSICKDTGITNASTAMIPKDETHRGDVSISQSPIINAFSHRGMENICTRASNRLVLDTIYNLKNSKGIDESIKSIVRNIMGIPPNHPKYDAAVVTGHSIYLKAEKLGIPPVLALRHVFVYTCLSPEVAAIGI